MAQSLRQIKSRIKSVENTRKLTRAMEMISVSKLKRTEKLLAAAAPYSDKLEKLMYDILKTVQDTENTYLIPHKKTGAVALLMVTSDTGLCGMYNHALLRLIDTFVTQRGIQAVHTVAVGKKGFLYCRKRGLTIQHSYLGFNGRFSNDLSLQALTELDRMYCDGIVDEVYIAYSRIETAARSKPVIERFLPIEPRPGKPIEYILETNLESIYQGIIPLYLANKLRSVLLHAFTSEHKARAISMGEATKNAVDLLESLILQRNKMRQASITKEILEIVSSAEALKGS
ncbi:MAG TPA: ATP synthase F1 subunit gamma [Candidatus Omnitrophota bacterium]|nr:ATP synthase F1 subunit gamma [Candidatus Omnitrophota bacterium]HPT07299.1 ATP synthase F1 subunit gamma [Candidatus Omnitrophota bacterium]